MNFLARLTALFGKLGFTDKAKARKLSKEEWDKIFASYKEEYGTDLEADLKAAEKFREMESNQTRVLKLLNETQSESAHDNSPENQDDQDPNQDLYAMVKGLVDTNKTLSEKIAQISPTAMPDTPTTVLKNEITINGPGNTTTHFLGIEHPMFAMNQRWNQIAANPGYATLNPVNETEHAEPFYKEVMKYGASLANRYNELKKNNQLDPVKLASGDFGFDTTRLPDAGLGDQFMVRRQDALIARILTLRTVTDLFPVRYGIQDREMITNAYFGEISQAYQEGEIWKGEMKLEPEFGYVDDVMVKTKFGSMKEIERKYIAYLNTDGSDPVKWSMIEFALLNLYKVMQTEQNKRRMMGIYVKPEEGKPGSYLNGSTGVIYTLLRYIHENKLLLHDDDSYYSYDNTDMLECVQEFVEDILTTLTEDQELTGKYIYLNLNHQSWWVKNVRRIYGKDTDFTGPNGYLNIVPDTTLPIKWVPNLGQLPLMLIQEPGNLQFLEFLPGEMFGVKIKEDMELVKAWSTWKEGTSASFVGPTFRTAAELKANAYLLQQIFMNKPCKELDQDATTIEINPKSSFWYLTQENTAATVLTEIKNPRKGIAYVIECGSTVNATEIHKTGVFSTISSNWTPTWKGDYIMVIANSEGKFLELERQVGGRREINKTLQPNVPGAR